jgi:hypothetical protein
MTAGRSTVDAERDACAAAGAALLSHLRIGY